MDAKQLINELTATIQQTANVKAVFGEPVRQGDVSIIPVARVVVRGGGGGGGGSSSTPAATSSYGGSEPPATDGKGSGMGLGVNIVSSPVGYIRIKGEEATFQPIIDRNKMFVIAGVTAVLGTLFAGKMARR